MTDLELRLLRQVAAGELLFHNSVWTTGPGYLWRGPDGSPAGTVPPDAEAALDRLAGLGCVTTEHRLGPHDCRVFPTLAGLAVLEGLTHAA